MGGIWIFGGTREGRRLAEFCARRGLTAEVSVATEYGEQVLEEGRHGTVIQDRMSEAQMREHIRTCDVELVIDATHPYAVEVTENIRRACKAESAEYLRLLRGGAADVETGGLVSVESAAEAADYLSKTEGNIMLTTGSKDLPVFCKSLDVKRLYPRVLPSVESLTVCGENKIPMANCIAMQGPFCEEVNRGLLTQYRCRFLVTKESGTAGGFEEKIAACQSRGDGGGDPASCCGRRDELFRSLWISHGKIRPSFGRGAGWETRAAIHRTGGNRHGDGKDHDGGSPPGNRSSRYPDRRKADAPSV